MPLTPHQDVSESLGERSEEQRVPAVTWGSLRWGLGALPWVLVVLLLAWADSGCVPTPPDDSSADPTPFPYFGDDDDSVSSDDDDGGIGGPYPAVLRPDFDEVGVSRLRGQWVDFSEEGVEPVLTLSTADGQPVPGSAMRVGPVRTLYLPDEPLTGEMTYTMRVQWGDDSELEWNFVTRSERPAVESLDGVTLAWDIAGAGASSPPGGEAFVGALPLGILTELTGDGSPGVLAGMANTESDPVTQDLCVATFEPTEGAPALWNDPLIGTPPVVLRLSVDLSIAGFGVTVLPLRDVRLTAELAATEEGVTGIAEGTFVGWVDAREVAVAGVCDTLASVAIECVPCPGDGEDQCLVFALEDIEGEALNLSIQTRSVAEIKADPDCQPE